MIINMAEILDNYEEIKGVKPTRIRGKINLDFTKLTEADYQKVKKEKPRGVIISIPGLTQFETFEGAYLVNNCFLCNFRDAEDFFCDFKDEEKAEIAIKILKLYKGKNSNREYTILGWDHY